MAQPSNIFSLAVFAAATLLLPAGVAAQSAPPPTTNLSQNLSAAAKAHLEESYGKLPLSFERNDGQTDRRVKFLSRGVGQTLFLTSTEAVLVLGSGDTSKALSSSRDVVSAPSARSDLLQMKLLGAASHAEVDGLDALPGTINYFIGNDSMNWRRNVPAYGKVRYHQIYPGIDLVYYGNQRQLEYDFLAAPGADLGKIRIAVQGASQVFIDTAGEVVMRYQDRNVRLLRPHIYQEIAGQRMDIAGGYLLVGQEVRFAVGRYDHSQTLIIDPQLVYSTYLGGTAAAGDQAQAIAIDSAGNAYIAGQTSSINFPLAGTSPQAVYGGGSSDAFVAKLNAAGNALVYSTYLGGSGIDAANGIAIDGSGSVYITGDTNSTNFPVSSPLQSFNNGGYDAFVTKLSPDGATLVYSTYLGGSHDEIGSGIAIDNSGNTYVAGYTNSTDFPLSAPFQSTKGSGTSLFSTAFVSKLNAAGSALVYSTYLGGASEDFAYGIAVDAGGSAYVTGYTDSTNFPLASPFQNTLKGTFNAFVSKLNPAGSALSYSTYLGGSSNDIGKGIAVDSSGNAYVAGRGSSTDFPMGVSLQSVTTANGYGFVTKFNNTGSLLFATLLGGSSGAAVNGIAVDSAGNSYVTGNTPSADFPLSSPVQPVLGGAADAFVTVLNPAGSSALYSTYLGGSGFENSLGIAVDSSGNAYITGGTTSANYPVLSPYQAFLKGGGNAFVSKISPQSPTGVPTLTTVSSSQNPVALAGSITFTATVSAAGGTPTGSVIFYSNGFNIGGASLAGGQGILTIAGGTLGLGSHSITASYSGDSQFAASFSLPALLQNVRALASSTVLVSSVPSTTPGQPVIFTATVTGVGTTQVPTGSVLFSDGQKALGTVSLSTAGKASLTATSLALGTHSVTAEYLGDTNFGGSVSSPVSVSITPPATIYSTNSVPVGTGPIAAAVNPLTSTLFIVNQGSNNVTAIDTRTNSLISVISTDAAPSAIAINTTTNQIYVANRDSADVTVIDGASFSATNVAVTSGQHPIAIAVNEKTNAVYIGTEEDDVAVLQGNTVSHPGQFLGGPIAIAMSPLSEFMYVAESHDATIEGYQPGSNFLFSTFTVGQPEALAINAPLIFAADAFQKLDIMNEATNQTANVPLAPSYAVAVNPVDGEVYVATRSSAAGQPATVAAISVSNTSTSLAGAIDVLLPVGQTPVPPPLAAPNKLAIDSTNNLVYVANEASNDVTVIDGSALAVVNDIPVGTFPTAVVLNPANCSSYVTNFSSNSVTVLAPQVNGPGICLSSNSLNFPAQPVNTTSAPQTVTLTNIGNAPLLISSIMTTPSVFIESDNCGPTGGATTNAIAPGTQCQIQAAFGSATQGTFKGQILINDNNSGTPHTIVLTGNAVLVPTVTLAVDSNPAVFGQIVNLTANVAGSLGTPTGTVTFLDGQTVLATLPLRNGTANTTDALQTLGSRNLTAMYWGDLTYSSGSSPVLTETVNKASTQFSVFLSTSITSTAGNAVTFDATLQILPPGSGPASEPSGQVTFYDGATALGSAPIQFGNASFSTSALSVGSHSITANYPGDSNLLGSTSPVLTQVVVASGGGGTGGTGSGGTGSGGTGGGTGGTVACACTKTGNYVDPVPAVDATVGTPSFATFQSPHGKYTVNVTIDNTTQQITIGVTRNSDNVVVFASQAFDNNATWSFSPDDDRFVLHDPQPSSLAGYVIDQYYVFDLMSATASQPIHTAGQAIVYDSPQVAGSRLQFSPSGRYFVYTALVGNQQTDVYIYRVQGVAQTHEPPIYHSFPFSFQVAPGTAFGEPGNSETEDAQTGGVGWGFSPDQPETSFVYAYGTGPGIFQWVLVNLAAGTAKSYPYGALGAPIISAFWQFDPCANVAAVVTEPNPTQEEVDWYSTSTDKLLPGSNAVFPLTSITLGATSSGEQAVDSTGQVQAHTASPCSQPNTPAPPPGAPPVSVTPQDPSSSTSPVTLTFTGGVSQPGQTTLSISSTPPAPPTPNAFQLGNPPMYYNLNSTATFTPPVTICINYIGVSFNNNSAIQLFHYDSTQNPPSWVNITVPNSQVNPPPPPNTVCGNTNSLSPFALFEPSGSIPTNIVPSAGTPQSAISGTAFATPFAATVSNSNGPVSGATVTFVAPAAGATGNFGGATLAFATTNASGVATAPAFTASGIGGSYSLTATVNGAATPAVFSLTNALLTTTSISAPSITYGTAASVTVSVNSTGQSATGSVTLSVDGAAGITLPLTNGAAVFNLGALSAGSHALSANFAVQGSFASSAANATLTVVPAALTITANSATRQYGQANPALNGAMYSGFVNGDNSSSLSGNLACTTTASAGSSVGTYPITCSGVNSPNYAIVFQPGVLTVTPATLTLAASSGSRPYGANNPVLAPPLISGIQNGDAISSNYSLVATPNSPVGTYPLVPFANGAASVLSNYSISLVNGTLAVVPEVTSLNVIFSPASIAVGQSTTATLTLTGPDMVIPLDPSVLAAITLTSPIVSDILSNNGVCIPIPGATPGMASCTVTITSTEPNGRTLNASFAGSADLAASSAPGDLIVTAALLSQQVCIASDFRNVAVPGGSTLWFNSIFKVRDVTKQLVHVTFFASTVQFQYTDATGTVVTVNQALPDAHVTIDPRATVSGTSFDAVNNVWNTTIPWDLDDNAFLTGFSWTVPSAGLPADVEPVTVCGIFASDVAGIDIGWRWAAAAYSSFGIDYNTLGVKPMDTDNDNPPKNFDRAGTPENYKQFVKPGARGKGGTNYTGTYSGSKEIE